MLAGGLIGIVASVSSPTEIFVRQPGGARKPLPFLAFGGTDRPPSADAMKFADEAHIHLLAGRGGDGGLSFRRARSLPRGGPDGGDGGRGGSIYLEVASGLNTLADFRRTTRFRAGDGQPGGSNRRAGCGGKDLRLQVPPGTRVFEEDAAEMRSDLLNPGECLLVARGGEGGRGNVHFKSGAKRSPRQFVPGEAGQECRLRLELRLLADVGLVGLPNAGKSSFLRAVSAACPEVADYPFTTLQPQLGMVAPDFDRRFAVADVPGLIPGAARGAGLGLRFLRHLARTRLLLHLVDLAAEVSAEKRAAQVRSLERELAEYDPNLAQRPRWLVLNKTDLLAESLCRRRQRELLRRLDWRAPCYMVSARTGRGCSQLCQAAADWLGAASPRRQGDSS